MHYLARIILAHAFMMADPPSGGGGGADTMEVDLPEVGKVVLPKAEAEKVIKARDALKENGRKIGERLGALEAEKKAADDKVKKAEEDRALAEAAKAGELDKVREISERKLRAVADKYGNKQLESLIGANKDVIPAAVADIAKQLASGCRFDLDSESFVIIDAAGKPRVGQDGKPLSVDALIGEFLDARPYLKLPSGSPGSGAAGSGQRPAGRVITRAELDAMSGKEQAAFFADGGTLKPS